MSGVKRFGYIWGREFDNHAFLPFATITKISKAIYRVFVKLFPTLEYIYYDKLEDIARFEKELEEDVVGGSFFDERRGEKLDQYQYIYGVEAAKCSDRRMSTILQGTSVHLPSLLLSQLCRLCSLNS